MIQRVQTLFLLAVVGFLSAVLFLPIWSEANATASEQAMLNAYQMTISQDADMTIYPTFYIAIAIGLAIAVAIWSIFMYKNRLTQVKLGMVNSLLMAAAIGVTVFFVMKGEPLIDPSKPGVYEVGFYMYLGAMMSNLLSNRFIRKDERLVKSVDRLR